MQSLRVSVCACLLSTFCAFNAGAATSLQRLIPEQAGAFVAVHDVPKLLQHWKDSPWSKTWNDEQVQRYFAPLRAQMKADAWSAEAKEKTGYTLEELLAFATGDAIIVVPDFGFVQEKSQIPELLIAIDVGDNGAKIEELFAKAANKGPAEETSEFSGITVHTLPAGPDKKNGEPDTPATWAIVEGKWLLSPSKDAVVSAIDAVQKGGLSNSWESAERRLMLEKRVGESEFTFILNAQALYPAMKASIEADQKASGEKSGGPFGFDSGALLSALGLDTWRDLYFTAKMTDDATVAHAGLTYSEIRGLTKLAAYKEGPVAQPSFVSAGWTTVSTAQFSLRDAWSALEEMLEAFNPAISGMVQGQIRKMNKDLGIDLKRDLIGNLGDTIVAAQVLSPNANPSKPAATDFEQLVVISLQNADVFANAIDAFRRSMGPNGEAYFKTRDYLGQKIMTFEQPGQDGPGARKGVSYAIAKGYVFLSIGSAAPVESALQGLTGEKPTLWEKPEVKTALAELPANASAFQYQDVRAVIASVFQTLSLASNMVGSRQGAGAAVPEAEEGSSESAEPQLKPADRGIVDPTAQPDAETIAKYWSHSWGHASRDSDGIHVVQRIVYPK
jgi:Protein of unknown function (DUF3352)